MAYPKADSCQGRLLGKGERLVRPCPVGVSAAAVPQAFVLPTWMELTLGLNLKQKQDLVAELSQQVAKAQSVVIAEYRSLSVADMTELRRSARGAGVYLRVYKNTLARRAVADTPFSGLAEHMFGPLAYGISTDPVAAAKVLSDYAKKHGKLVVKGGAMPNRVMSATDVTRLASLPSREQLLAQLMGTMRAPVAKFVQTLNEVPGKFVRTLAAVHEQREKQSA
jgi:large subunit ribosomal protein L10